MAGIGRIEDRLKNKLEQSDKNISVAFKDLSKLISMAEEMTRLSKSIASKIKDETTNDETIKFKSYLLELGIEQQFDICSSSEELARQIASIVRPIMARNKQNQMTLSDIYCCFNRARGVSLVSPDDIMSACRRMETIPDLQLKLVRYQSGLLVVQDRTCDDSTIMEQTTALVEESEFLTPLQMATRLSIPVQLARQRLLDAETAGNLCRDVSIESLRFYPNKFLHNSQQEALDA